MLSTGSDVVPCVRKCTQARRHVDECRTSTECPDHTLACRGCQPRPLNACKGCWPRPASHGLLCEGCHVRLVDWLRDAPWQHWLLLGVAQVPSLSQELKMTPGHGGVDEAPSPLNIAAATSATVLSDVLCEWVEMLVQQYAMAGPFRLSTQALRFDPRPRPRWSAFAVDWVWVDPPALFEVRSACRWLEAQVDRLQACPGIGDLWDELGEAMAAGHALVPWHEQAARLKGIECPECHTVALARLGGDEHVTCGRCNAHISPGRYAIWTRILASREKVGA